MMVRVKQLKIRTEFDRRKAAAQEADAAVAVDDVTKFVADNLDWEICKLNFLLFFDFLVGKLPTDCSRPELEA